MRYRGGGEGARRRRPRRSADAPLLPSSAAPPPVFSILARGNQPSSALTAPTEAAAALLSLRAAFRAAFAAAAASASSSARTCFGMAERGGAGAGRVEGVATDGGYYKSVRRARAIETADFVITSPCCALQVAFHSQADFSVAPQKVPRVWGRTLRQQPLPLSAWHFSFPVPR